MENKFKPGLTYILKMDEEMGKGDRYTSVEETMVFKSSRWKEREREREREQRERERERESKITERKKDREKYFYFEEN